MLTVFMGSNLAQLLQNPLPLISLIKRIWYENSDRTYGVHQKQQTRGEREGRVAIDVGGRRTFCLSVTDVPPRSGGVETMKLFGSGNQV